MSIRLLLLFLIALSSLQSFAQIQVCLGTDAVICQGQTVQITNCANAGGPFGPASALPYTQATIPYAPDPLTNGTSVALTDDGQSGLLPIGFSFCYFGNTYTNFVIGANNFITFTSGGSGTWVTTTVPNAGAVPKNAIMGPWQDINPGAGGTVKYAVYGTAPFRRLSVSWNNIPMFSCSGQLYSSQITIYETSNNIETHIQNKSICAGWNSGNAVHALHNINGTVAVVVPGRNNTQWAATNNSIRFSPGTPTLEWTNTLGQTFPYNGGVLNVNPVPAGVTGYWLRRTCGGTGAISDTTWLSQSNVNATGSSTTDICSGSVGTATATPTAGTGPFQYLWSPSGQTTQTATNLTAGTYQVIVTDVYGCTKTLSVVVPNSTATYSGSTTPVSCQGGNNGTATATMTPAIGTLSYNWYDAGGQTTQIATGLSAGTYHCQITSNLGCVGTVTVTVTELPALTVQLVSQQDISCNGANDGSASVSVSGGTPQYSYLWTNSASNGSSATDLSPGSHTITVTDINNCSAYINLLINEPSALSIIASTPVSCVGGNNGTATAQMTSLLGTVSYNWYDAGGQTTATATGLSVGTYHCEATSTVGCIDTVAVTITQIPTLSATLFQQDVACNGGNNGYMAVTVSGGTPQYTYSWNNSSSTGPSANDLSVGQQTVTITDANNCVLSMSATLAEPTALSIVSITPVTCQGGSNGAATVSMTSLLGTVSYNWYDAGGQTTASVSGLSAGTYHCEATSTVGCSDTIVVIIPELPPMVIQLTQQNVSCNSGNNGSITATVNGGAPNLSYSWSNNPSLSNVAANLVAGTYVLTVTDNNNCVATASATITEPSPLTITSITPNQTICPGNATTLSASASGGSSAYTFTWSENGTVIGTGSSFSVTPVATNTTYCVVLSEACGSPTANNCLVITFPQPIVPSFVSDKTTSCQPGTFTFTNTSTNQTDIATVLLDFGDGNTQLLNGSASATHTFNSAQSYDLTVTITSIYGCVYTTTMNSIVSVIANPVADFNMSANPTTIFETTVTMQDKSTNGVSSWTWSSPGSNPSSSVNQNPTFHFPDGVVAQYPIVLVVQTPEGCIDSVEHILSVNSDVIFYAPNSFTPDGNEFNQNWLFYVSGIDEYHFELLIFDRWGEIIWETHDVHSSWDGTYHGKIVPQGAYSWIARVKDLYSDSKQEFNGLINVLR